MKKNYIKPEIEITRYETEGMIAASGDVRLDINNNDADIIYSDEQAGSKGHSFGSIWD